MPHVLPDDLCVDMIEPPEVRVEQLLAHVIQLAARKNASINYQHHGLYLPLSRKPGLPLDSAAEAIPMEGMRTLASYRLRPEDQLIFRDRSADVPKMERLGKHLQKTAPGNLFVVIESSVHGSSKIYGFAPNTTVGEVAHTFTETNPVTDIQEYGLFVKATGVRMEALHRLSSFPLRTLDTLVFKRLDQSDVARLKGEVEADVSPNDVFGTDPATLPRLLDYAVEVPAVLATLRAELMHHNGLDQQGVFRLGGEERKMVKMQKELNRGAFVPHSTLEEDVFGVAALIKRWFGELPVRIFEVFPLKRLDRAAEGQAQALALIEELREPYKSILMWFVYLLVDAATRRATTLMDCNNLAIVVAPVLTSIPLSNPMEGLIMTQRVTQIMRQVLDAYLAKAESGQLDNLRAPAAQPIPEPKGLSAEEETAALAVAANAAAALAQVSRPPPTLDAAALVLSSIEGLTPTASPIQARSASPSAPVVHAAPLAGDDLTSRASLDSRQSVGGRKETSPWKRVTHADVSAASAVLPTTSRNSSAGAASSRASVDGPRADAHGGVGSAPGALAPVASTSPLAMPRRSVPSTSPPSLSPRGLSPLSSPRTPSQLLGAPPVLVASSAPSQLATRSPQSSPQRRNEVMSATLAQLISTTEFFPPADSPPASPRPGPVLPPPPRVDPRALSPSPRPYSALLPVSAPPPPLPVSRASSVGEPLAPVPRPVSPRPVSPLPTPRFDTLPPPPPAVTVDSALELEPGAASAAASAVRESGSGSQTSPRVRTVVVVKPGAPPRSLTPSSGKKYPAVPAPTLRSVSAPSTPQTGSPATASPLALANVAAQAVLAELEQGHQLLDQHAPLDAYASAALPAPPASDAPDAQPNEAEGLL